MKAPIPDRVRGYLASIPGAVSGSGGHAATFHVACVLVQGFDLTVEGALPLMQEWNANCQPPWSDAELRHKLQDASRAPSHKPRGYLLGETAVWRAPIQVRSPIPPTPLPRALPDRSGFGPGSREQIHRLSALRPYHREGLEWASERGLLVFGNWNGFECHGLTDTSGRVFEIRRMDGMPFPAVPNTSLAERKSHAVKGSQKAWPVGMLEAEPFPRVAIVEGLPDFLAAHYVALWEQASNRSKRDPLCAPIAMLSASPHIHPDALGHFIGKIVRIFPHSDGAGLRGAAKWQKQLLDAGASHVDVWDFSRYRKSDGSGINDLWEMVHRLAPGLCQSHDAWRMLP